MGVMVRINDRTRTATAFVGLLVTAPLLLAYGAIRFVSPQSGPAFLAIAAAAVTGTVALVPFLWRRSERWPDRIRPGFVVRQVGWGLLFGLLLIAVIHAFAFLEAASSIEVALNLMGWEFLVGFWIYVTVGGFVFAERARARRSALERAAAEARLAALVTRLRPHFLFNVLTSIIELIDESPAAAERAVGDLSVLLRRAVAIEPRQDVPLAEELDSVERYLELERLRLGDRLRVRVETSGEALGRPVPLFGVQTLVENAVRHGLAKAPGGGDIEVRAEVEGDRLRVVVRDTGPGCEPGKIETGEGRGIATLRDILAARYGPGGRLSVATAPGAGFTATLEIPAPAA